MPPGRIPSVDNDVVVVTGTVPTAVAGMGFFDDAVVLDVPEPAEDEDPLDVPDDEVESPEDCSTCCTRAEIWLLTRFSAVELAILDRPLDSLTTAEAITLISALLAEDA